MKIKTETKEKGWSNYIRIPYLLAKEMFDANNSIRQVARLHMALIMESYFIKGEKEINGQSYICEAGECFTSCRKLEKITDLSRSVIHRLLDSLVKKEEIQIFHLEEISLIRLKKYTEWNESFYRNKNNRRRTEASLPELPDLGSPSEEEMNRVRRIAEEREKRRNRDRTNKENP